MSTRVTALLPIALFLAIPADSVALLPQDPPAHTTGLSRGPTASTAEDPEPPAPVRGHVLDASGSFVPGAVVLLRSAGERPREVITDGSGAFEFAQVPARAVTLLVQLEQFRPVTLTLDRPASDIRIVLHPAPVSAQVTVHGHAESSARIATATRTDTPLRDVPQAVTVVGRQTLGAQAAQSMTDAMRYVPGVTMAQGEGNRDMPVFRGNGSTADFLVDGLRDDVQYLRDLYNVERIETMKGPNAMIFGRGGAGGVINRVTRQAELAPVGEVTLHAGAFDSRRATLDVGRAALGSRLAVRTTAMYEDSGSYRDGVGLERYGVNPTLAFWAGSNTTFRLGYERFHDDRTADRGITSYKGRPIATSRESFFGDPDQSTSTVSVNAATFEFEHAVRSGLSVRSRTRFADYDKFYQNVYPGAADAAGRSFSVSAYNHGTKRQNLFNQTDVEFVVNTGRVGHHLLAGVEAGRQQTANLRHTGYFRVNGKEATTVSVPVATPRIGFPLAFRQNATDADNDSTATVLSAYLQDQVRLSRRWQAVLGLRLERFDIEFLNNRTRAAIDATDTIAAPRAGLVFRLFDAASLYASYTQAYQPRAGEQLASLTVTNRSLAPERFRNYEGGLKWDLRRGLSATASLYRLDRTNVAVPDAADPTRLILVDGQRSSGLELEISGRLTDRWSVQGGYAYQQGELTTTQSATARAGARLAQWPKHTASLWNRVQVWRKVEAGIGLTSRTDLFTSTDNTVVLPGFTRVDAVVSAPLGRRLRLQVNGENLADNHYFVSAHSNTNIMPGSPRAVRATLIAAF